MGSQLFQFIHLLTILLFCGFLLFLAGLDLKIMITIILGKRKESAMKDYTKLSQEEKDALVKKAMDVGFQTETDYGNCIQSCLYGLYCAFPDFGITKDMLKASFGIAGGTGCSLMGTCGALNAAAWAISLCEGRPIDDLGGKYGHCHAKIREVVDKFNKEYDGVLCADVMRQRMGDVYDWKTPEGLKGYNDHQGTFHCATAMAFCAEIIARMIVDGELKNDN